MARIGMGGAGGDGVFLGQACADSTHHICNLTAVSNPAGFSSSWANIAYGPALSADGRFAYYAERADIYVHRVKRRNLVTGETLTLWETTTPGVDTSFGELTLIDGERFLVFPDVAIAGDRNIRLCDLDATRAPDCVSGASMETNPPGPFTASQVKAVR